MHLTAWHVTAPHRNGFGDPLVDTKKIFVSKRGSAAIHCGVCGAVKNVPVEQFKGVKHVLKIKCPCGNVFSVTLDFRQQYRKNTHLEGRYIAVGPEIQEPGKRDQTFGKEGAAEWKKCTIINLSLSGLRMRLKQPDPSIELGKKIRICFHLDDKAATEIDREVLVKNIGNGTIGCEFLDIDLYDKVMGFYLLP